MRSAYSNHQTETATEENKDQTSGSTMSRPLVDVSFLKIQI